LNPKGDIILNLPTLTRTLALCGGEEDGKYCPRERVKGVQQIELRY
jgi:hypothetical protein